MDLGTAPEWFVTTPVGDGVTLLTEPWLDTFLRSNLWLVKGSDRLLLVDTGFGLAPLRIQLQDLFDLPVIAVATHSHSDHMGGLHEFDERWAHAGELERLRNPDHPPGLRAADYEPEFRREMEQEGFPLRDLMLDAMPVAGFDPDAFATQPAEPTRLVDEGDLIDLGDRRLEVLHLPGHTPGSIGLWEAATGILLSGDTVFTDAPLLDEFPESDIESYRTTMRRLRELPVRVVHGGHERSFERGELISICDAYLGRRGEDSR